MSDSVWFYNVSIDPRDLATSRRLLSLPDGSWLDVVDSSILRLGNAAWAETVTLPVDSAIANDVALEAETWSTVGIVSTAPVGGPSRIEVYFDGYLVTTLEPAASYFRMIPGRITLGSLAAGFHGWVDDFKVIARHPNAEVICNHARGTLVGLTLGDAQWTAAEHYSDEQHQAIHDVLPSIHKFTRYICERPIDKPASAGDLDDHSHYMCLGQTRRLDPKLPGTQKCVRSALLFPEGLFFDAPRESTLGNAFCLSCHSSTHPSETMKAATALAGGVENMACDMRRQPMQHPPKLFGIIPMGFFIGSPATPDEDEQAPDDGEPIDLYTTPSSLFPQ